MILRGCVALGVAAALISSSGCGLTRKAAEESTLRVDVADPAVRPTGPRGGPLALAPVLARGSAADRRYVYIDPASPRQVRQAATLFWEEPPPRLVERALNQGLSARLNAPVVAADQAPGAERRLSVRVDRFEEHSGPTASAVVELDAAVVDLKQRALGFAKTYCGRAPVSGAAPSDRARAFEVALGQVLDAMAADLRRPAGAVQPGGC